MSDTLEHNPGDHEDPLSGPTWIVGFLSAVLLAVIGLGLTALYYNAQREEERLKVVQRDPMELVRLRQIQEAVLSQSPRFVEERVQVEGRNDPQIVKAIAIPIDQAMELVAREFAATQGKSP